MKDMNTASMVNISYALREQPDTANYVLMQFTAGLAGLIDSLHLTPSTFLPTTYMYIYNINSDTPRTSSSLPA